MTVGIQITKTGDVDVLEQVVIPAPQPGPAHVLVRNRAAAVNFIDTIIRRGAMPEGGMPNLPHILGVEGAGIVEAVGDDVKNYQPGDRVAWMGPLGAAGYSSYSALSAHALMPIPPGIGFAEAAALPVNAMTAWQLLVKIGHVRPGDTVLVRAAAGGVGTMLIQLAKHLGASVIAVCSARKRDFVLAQGADHALAHGNANLSDQVLQLTGGNGVDASCNPVSGSTVTEDLRCLAPFGRLMLFGFLAGEPEGAFAPDLVRHFSRSVSVHVSDIYTLYQKPEEFSDALRAVGELQAEGRLRPAIHARFDLKEAGKAHQLIERGSVMGKIILDVQ